MWILVRSETRGVDYWYNIQTGTAQWEAPGDAAPGDAAPGDAAPTPWREFAAAPPRRGKAHNGVFALHNWVKAVAIELACAHTARPAVLDVGCGRGGDAAKFARAGAAAYVGVDAEAAMVEAARARPPPCAGARHAVLDMRDRDGARALAAELGGPAAPGGADAAVCMFALHHAFATEEGGAAALDLLCGCAGERGSVAVMIPDGDAVARRLGARGAYSNSVFSARRAGEAGVVFEIPGATPADDPEPLLGAKRLRAELAARGFGHVVLEGTPRQVLARYPERTGQRRAMHVPATLRREQWALADLQYVVVARRAGHG